MLDKFNRGSAQRILNLSMVNGNEIVIADKRWAKSFYIFRR